ncbi:MAG: hypothetical protein AB1512_21330 [Thermodesulfobacteriota bacterium]
MSDLTKDRIDYLIHCQKTITDPPRKEMLLGNGHWRNGMKLQSTDGQHDFSVFIRKNEDFEENFSIGLIYLPREVRGDICLLRCNGPHGPHVNFEHHDRAHIHMADEEALDVGLKAERSAHITVEYASFWDGLGYFVKKCNIIDAEKYFPAVSQRSLFLGKGE